jgi:dipeptidyl aminopeptidase/acylaminoacyl peptidase
MLFKSMLARRLSAWVVLGAVAAAAVDSSAAAPADDVQFFGVRDLVRLERISEVAVSPDGDRVAYSLRTTDMDAHKAHTSVWLLDLRKRDVPPVRLTDIGASSGAAEWSADGNSLYYLSNGSGSNQVWRRDVRSDAVPRSEAQQVTALPFDVGTFRVAPAGARILVSMDAFIDCPDLACTKQRLDTAARSPGHGVLYDKLLVRHWDKWNDGRRSRLFVIPLDASGVANGTPVDLTRGIDGDVPGKPMGGREDYAWSPDGRDVVFSVRALSAGEAWSTNFDIFRVAASGGQPQNLTADNLAWDAQPAFSPDGSQLAYLAMERPGFEADRFHLVLLDLKTGKKRPLTQNWDRSILSFAWSPGGRTLFATTDHLGQRPLWAIDVGTGHASALTGEGDVNSFGVGPHQVLYTQNSLGSPANLYEVGAAGGTTRQLTHLNQTILAHRKLSSYEQFNFPGWNGEKVFGYLVKPADFQRDRKYPVALVVHGGPQGSMGNLWHWRFNAQTLAGAGYAVVMIDFHGSNGYGQAFTDSISGDWGGKPLEDLKLGLAAAQKQYPWLDEDRMCALGGSYGGYMMNWIAGQWPDRFKCLVTSDGLFDLRSMYYSTEELWFLEWENGGPEYLNPAGYTKHNPADYVSRWKTPTLVIHGQLDYRVPLSQGLGVYTALQRRGIASELLYFPDENHWVLKPDNVVEWYDTVIAWMNRWARQ